MPKLIAALLVCVVCLAAFVQTNADESGKSGDKPKAKKLLRHVVLFKFEETATKKEVQRVVDAFAALPGKIDAIADFEMGTDVSVENKTKGFTHGFVVTFRDAKGREEYLPHPAHKAFGKIVGPVLDDVLVFDFWAKQ